MKKVIAIFSLICMCLYSCKEENETFIEEPPVDNATMGYEIFDEPIDNFQQGLVTTDSVYCLLENNDSIDGYVCYIGQKKGDDLPLVVKIDTLGIIRSIFCENTFYDFIYKEKAFDIVISSQNEDKTISDISYNIFNTAISKSNTERTRANSSSNGIDGWASMANKIATIASIGEIASNPSALSSKVGVLTIIGGMSNNKYIRRPAIAIDLIMSLKNGGVLGTVMGLYSLYEEWRNEVWFGDVNVTTLGAERITDSLYRVYCQVNNFNKISQPDILGTRIIMRLEKHPVILGSYLSGNNMVSLSNDVTKDGVYYFEFDNLELGQTYCFQPHLYRTWTEFHSGAENMSVSDILMSGGNIGSVSVADCKSDVFMYGEIGTFATNSSSIESIEISKCETAQEKINFVLTVKGTAFAAPNNDKETIGQGSIGIYTIKDGEYKYYPANKINGNNFSAELSFEESIYTMDDVDYSNFVTSKQIEIGSYIMAYQQKGQYEYDEIYYYSDTQNYKLVYNQKPNINIYNIAVTSIEPYSDDDGRDLLCRYTYTIEATGSFFFNNIITVNGDHWTTPGYQREIVSNCEDGTPYTINSSYSYFSSGTNVGPIYFKTTLRNGSEYIFPQTLYCDNGTVYSSATRIRSNTYKKAKTTSKNATVPKAID